jgi:hypothetical protein
MGCQLLCTLARMHAPAATHVTFLANKVFGIAASLLSSGQQTPGSEATLQVGPRCVLQSCAAWGKPNSRAALLAASSLPGFSKHSGCLFLAHVVMWCMACIIIALCLFVLVVSCRMLYMMGQLCRHGADIIDAEAAQNPSTHNCTECLELCVR